jgi:ADP-heptose:LPS heptosyltransferase
MHILSCANIPIYGLFGPTNPRRTHALGQKNRVINASSYFPLSDDKFNPGKISQITLSHVLEKIKRDNLIS